MILRDRDKIFNIIQTTININKQQSNGKSIVKSRGKVKHIPAKLPRAPPDGLPQHSAPETAAALNRS